jgi:hypothetical protein
MKEDTERRRLSIHLTLANVFFLFWVHMDQIRDIKVTNPSYKQIAQAEKV